MADKEKILTDTLATVIKNEGMKNPEVKIRLITTSGANYSSLLYAITVRSPGRDDLELFAKVSCLGEQMRKEAPITETYAIERFAYRDLSKMYENLQRQYNISEEDMFLFPKFYAVNDKYLYETLILENLAVKGYTLYDRFSSATWEYASAAVGELAKFHALSYAFAEHYPEEFNKKVSKTDNVFIDNEASLFRMFKNSVATALAVVPEDSRTKLTEFFEKECTIEKYRKYYTSLRRPVLVHGDYRASNLMFKMMDGKLKKLIPVDYQTVHCGSPITDLLYFIFTGTDGVFRSHHYKSLIDYYYNTFADFLKKLGLNPEKLYPAEHFRADLNDSLPFGLLVASYVLPAVLVEEEKAPITEADASMSIFIVKPNERFKKRFREVLDDFLEWGVV